MNIKNKIKLTDLLRLAQDSRSSFATLRELLFSVLLLFSKLNCSKNILHDFSLFNNTFSLKQTVLKYCPPFFSF